VQTEAAFEIGEQAVHRHAGALEAGRPAKALRINPDRHFPRIVQWQVRFHLGVNLAESCCLSAAKFGWRMASEEIANGWPVLASHPPGHFQSPVGRSAQAA